MMSGPPDDGPQGRTRGAPPLSTAEASHAVRRLVEELRIHQAELEAQNVELNRVQQDLEASLRRFTDLYESAPLAYLTLNADGEIVQVNPSGANLLGHPREALLGRPLRGFIAAEAQDRYRDLMASLHDAGDTRAAEFALHAAPNAAHRTVQLEVRRTTPNVSAVMLIDMTERRLLERAVLDAATRERERLGADLHDGVAQELAGLSMELEALARRAEKDGSPLVGKLRQCAEASGHALQGCRALARGMSPLDERQGGLIQALRDLVGHVEGPHGPLFEVDIDERVPVMLADGSQEHLYRIAQEAISNVRRHSGARHARLSLVSMAHVITLTVEDDGTGLPASLRPDAMGLRLMRHRADAIGARLSVSSMAGKGTQVTCVCQQL